MEGVPIKILGRVTSNFSYKHDGTKFVREFSISCDPLALISLVSFLNMLAIIKYSHQNIDIFKVQSCQRISCSILPRCQIFLSKINRQQTLTGSFFGMK